MAYNPTEWKNGDVITAEKLNNIESGIQDAPGYSIEENADVIFNGDVPEYNADEWEGPVYATSVHLDNPKSITSKKFKVKFNNIEYNNLEIKGTSNFSYIGATISDSEVPDWEEFPFVIIFTMDSSADDFTIIGFEIVVQQVPQNTTIVLTNLVQEVETSDDFKLAINDALPDACKYNANHTIEFSSWEDLSFMIQSYFNIWNPEKLMHYIELSETVPAGTNCMVGELINREPYAHIPFMASFEAVSATSMDVFIYVCGLALRTTITAEDNSVVCGEVSCEPEGIRPITQLMFTDI